MKESVIDANSVSSVLGSGKPMCRFVKDLTFPDSSEVRPEQVFEKVWLVRNDGDVTWPSNTELVFVSGDDLPATKVYPVPSSVVPGQEVPLTVQLVAPPVEGRYISYFRLQNLNTSVPFGQRLWCDYRVRADTGSFPSGDCSDCKSSPEYLDELPQAIADAISSIIGDDAPHEALGKLLKTWQMVQHENEQPAAAMPIPTKGASTTLHTTPTTNPSVPLSDKMPDTVLVDENADGNEDDWQTLWQKEVTLLAAMGFEPFGDVLPLLQQHLVTPLTMKPQGPNGVTIDADGFQKVVNALLAARARDTQAAEAATRGAKAP